ncbi:MAG: hypothetical protein ACOCUS_05060 [Polyangiales bacterium]
MGRGLKLPLFVLGVLCALPVASAAAQDGDANVMILGIRALEGDDEFARNLTGALRHAATEVPGWEVSDRQVSLSQMTLAHECDEPDARCMAKVAEALDADRVVYGTVRRTSARSDFDFSLALYLFNAETGQIEQSVADSIPKVQSDIDNLRPRAARYVRQFSGQAQTGELRIVVNAPGAKVKIDGQQVGTVGDGGEYVAEGLAVGRHDVEVVSDERGSFRGSVTVASDEQTSLEATLSGGGTRVVETSGPDISWYTYASLGGAVVFFGLTVGAWAKLNNLQDDLDGWRRQVPEGLNACSEAKKTADGKDPGDIGTVEEGRDAASTCSAADTWEILQYVFLGLTAAAGGLGAYFLFDDLSEDQERDPNDPALSLTPSFGRHGASVDATLRF